MNDIFMNLRQITIKDQLELKKVYFDSIQSLDEKIYNQEQKRAWSSQAWDNPNFDKSITKGKGWLLSENGIIVAFATRYPKNRIALFYCKGKFQRKGYGSKLLQKLEDEAKKEGLNSLSTEASLISYRLFLKNKWEIVRKEKVTINNIFFERYKMTKNYKN
jgi:GNAT superfamily N-acetyltransferase